MPACKLNLRERLEDTLLDLSMSEIEEVPVKEIAQIKKATSLDLSNNQLKSLGKNFAPMLTHLMKLDLSNNQLTELPENFGELVNLRHLDLYSNQIMHLPLSLGQLKMLRWLDLKNNPLVPKLAEIAGPCLDSHQCQQCARTVVSFLQTMQVQVAEERQRRLLQKRKQQEMAEQAQKKEQQQQQTQKSKKKKSGKSSSNAQTKSENGVTSSMGAGDTSAGAKKVAPKQQSTACTHSKPASKVSSVLFRMIRGMFFGSLITILALYLLYVVDEEKFRGAQAHAVQVWNATVESLPVQVVETGQQLREMMKPTVEFARSKADAAYLWVTTDPSVQEYLEVTRALWNALCSKVYDICRTVNQQFPLYVETVKKKIF
ncbi:leucine-rich repeat-containing protein 59-like [Periplaneta americana]|uniref:leucine-rich repeat-containing protein 59-like n=1 Tax=Periplaneta americana TaxID=6978 RepID=UPI0037E97C02